VFAVNDLAALGLYTAARELGLAIPDDVAVAGHNDIPDASRLDPALTTIQVPVHEFGVIAAGLLITQVETGEREPRRILFSPQLAVRGSTARRSV
jgi:LacI family transcriptional regulator